MPWEQWLVEVLGVCFYNYFLIDSFSALSRSGCVNFANVVNYVRGILNSVRMFTYILLKSRLGLGFIGTFYPIGRGEVLKRWRNLLFWAFHKASTWVLSCFYCSLIRITWLSS